MPLFICHFHSLTPLLPGNDAELGLLSLPRVETCAARFPGNSSKNESNENERGLQLKHDANCASPRLPRTAVRLEGGRRQERAAAFVPTAGHGGRGG